MSDGLFERLQAYCAGREAEVAASTDDHGDTDERALLSVSELRYLLDRVVWLEAKNAALHKAVRDVNRGARQQAKRHGQDCGAFWKLRAQARAERDALKNEIARLCHELEEFREMSRPERGGT